MFKHTCSSFGFALLAGFILQTDDKANAAVFTIQPQNEAESKDTKIYSSVAGSNFSSNLNLVSADITDFRSLVQFDLSAVAGLLAADITTASLRLYVTGLNTNGLSAATSVPVTVSPILGDWRETSADPGAAPLATWSTFFSNAPTITYGAVAATQNASGVGYFDWDITSLVKSWKDGSQANYGVLLQAPGPLGDVGISDTDTPAFAPALIIASSVPEPASSGLVILSLLGLALRHRRA